MTHLYADPHSDEPFPEFSFTIRYNLLIISIYNI